MAIPACIVASLVRSLRGSTLNTLRWVAVGALAFALLLVFVAFIGSPVTVSSPWGLTGSSELPRKSIMAAILGGVLAYLVQLRPKGSLEAPAAPSSTRWRSSPWLNYGLLLGFLLTVNLLGYGMRQYSSWGLVTGHDQPQYFAYLHSWVFDHDIDFRNEYQGMVDIGEMMRKDYPDDPGYNVAPIGTPVLWLPFYLLCHAIVWALNQTGAALPHNGLSAPYAMAAAFGTVFWVFAGLWLIYRALQRDFSNRTAYLTTWILVLGTPLVWYLLGEPWMSHGAAFFGAACVLYLWRTRTPEVSLLRDAALGAMIGLSMLARPSQAILLILPLADAAQDSLRTRRYARPLAHLGVTFACALGVFALQAATWYAKTGLHAPPGSPMSWKAPALLSVLFSSHHGFIAWHPLVLMGFLGIPLLWRKDWRRALPLTIVVLLMVYVNAAITSWMAGASFGQRRLVEALPFLAPGIAALGTWLAHVCLKRPSAIAVAVLAPFACYNAAMFVQFRDFWVQPIEPVSFRHIWVNTAVMTHHLVGNMFSYPANLAFAWKYDVAPEQFDVLAAETPPAKAISYEREALRFHLGKGWDMSARAGLDGDGRFTATDTVCQVLLPLEAGRAYKLTIHLAIPHEFTTTQKVQVFVNGQRLGDAQLNVGVWSGVMVQLPVNSVHAGLNVVELRFDREIEVSWEASRSPLLYEGFPVTNHARATVAALLSKIDLEPVAAEASPIQGQ